ncbi:hypothetical protein ACS0TY_023808 [Phlomoides rotata]
MAETGQDTKSHVVVVSYPAQGHINPALDLANTKSATISLDCNSITIRTISDGYEEIKEPETVQAYFQRLQTVLYANLAQFIDEHRTTSSPKLIIYDSLMPWVLEIALNAGIPGAPLFTQSAAVLAVFYHLKQASLLRYPYELQEDGVVLLPSLPPLETGDLPSFSHFGDLESQQFAAAIPSNQFLDIQKADWIFINTFRHLENEFRPQQSNVVEYNYIASTLFYEQWSQDVESVVQLWEMKLNDARRHSFMPRINVAANIRLPSDKLELDDRLRVLFSEKLKGLKEGRFEGNEQIEDCGGGDSENYEFITESGWIHLGRIDPIARI